MQIILKPDDWTKLTACAICHEPSQTLFIVVPRCDAASGCALPDQLTAHAYPMQDDRPLPDEPALRALKVEAVLMLLFFDGIVAPFAVTPGIRSCAA